MKLLRKPEIMARKASDEAREAAEGLKIARKVDALRELAADEEKKLSDFRNASLRETQEAIGKLEEQRASLASEVASLQTKLGKMLPGMGTRREELDKKEKHLFAVERQQKQRKEELDLQELDILEDKSALASSLGRARTSEERANSSLKAAQERESASVQALERAQSIENGLLSQKNEQEKIFAEKEGYLAYRECELASFEAELKGKERVLNMEKAKLEDRKALLERNLERLRERRIDARKPG